MNMATKRDIVIIGNGIAGISAADAARQNNKEAGITVISNETYPAYYRLRLCELLSKENDDFADILLFTPEWYNDKNIENILGKKVVSITPCDRKLRLDTGDELSYERLIIASGSSSSLPDVPGNNKKGVSGLWHLDDAKRIRQTVKSDSRVVISGGGLLGLEAAYRLRKKGASVAIVEFFPNLLSRQLDKNGSEILEMKVKSFGIDLYTGTHVVSVNGDDSVKEVILDDGKILKADFLLYTTGVKPNTQLAAASDIKVNRGIAVDSRMLTSSPVIYACGDVAEFEGCMSGKWISALNQGKVAGKNASGGIAEYVSDQTPYFLNTMEIKLYSIGDAGKKDRQYDTVEVSNPGNLEYQKIFFIEGKCCGAILIGNIKNLSILNDSVKKHSSKDEDMSLINR